MKLSALLIFLNLTLKRSNFTEVNVPVRPDLAGTVEVGSDYSKNLSIVFDGAKKKKFEFQNYIYLLKIF